MSRTYVTQTQPKAQRIRCDLCGFKFPGDGTRKQCVQCLALDAIKAGRDLAPIFALATAYERDRLHIARPIATQDRHPDWKDLGDRTFTSKLIDGKHYGEAASRSQRASRRTRPTAAERRAEAKTQERIRLLGAWRIREAALPRTVTSKQREAMKAHALGESIQGIAARLGRSPDTIKDRIRLGERNEEAAKRKAIISAS